jgi:hypothetical protein
MHGGNVPLQYTKENPTRLWEYFEVFEIDTRQKNGREKLPWSRDVCTLWFPFLQDQGHFFKLLLA